MTLNPYNERVVVSLLSTFMYQDSVANYLSYEEWTMQHAKMTGLLELSLKQVLIHCLAQPNM